MGLAQSCLKAAKAPVKTGAEATCTPSRHKSEVGDVTIVPIFNGQDEAPCVNQACDVQSTSAPGTCLMPASVGRGDVHDAVLETVQISGALTATATTGSLQTTFMSSEGYPHSWELGPPSTDDEPSRVQALRALDILDAVSHGRQMRIDEEADMVLGALMQVFSAVTAMLVLFDDTRIIIRNSKGCMKPGEFPYRWSFCAYTLTKHRPQTLVVPDATKDVRFADNPFVRGAPHVRFYCGAPLVSASGHILGTVCFADDKPRSDFDVSHCYVMNNMAELLVRQLERYRANAGPAGPNDAETTALARVARTIECYDAVTGLVDISLPDGWMLMYVNEAWEALCAPWTRKQLVGRPLQRLLLLEEGDEEAMANQPPSEQPAAQPATAAPITAATAQSMRVAAAAACSTGGRDVQLAATCAAGSEGPGQLLDQGAPSVISGSKAAAGTGVEGLMVRSSSTTSTSGSCCTNRNPSAKSSSDCQVQGIVMREDESMDMKLEAMPAVQRRQWRQQHVDRSAAWQGAWQRYAGELRAGKEVELGRAKVLLEDGRPSTTVVRVTARSANCHVLDAAVRMPVGVPHHMALPPSILAAKSDLAATGDEDQEKAQMAEATAKAAAVAAADWMASCEPCYCFVTLNKIDRAAYAEARDYADVELGEAYQPVLSLLPSAGSEAARKSAGCNIVSGSAGGRPLSHAAVAPSTPYPSTCIRPAGAVGPLSPATRLSSMAQAVPYCGRPSLDNGTRGPASIASSVRGSMRSCKSQGFSNWTYGMEPIPGLKLGHLLGKGGYGRVFMGSYKGQKVAAKVVSNAMLKSATCVNGVTLEALLAQEIEHPYIVHTYKCVVRSYRPDRQQSTACMSARNSGHNAAFICGGPSGRGGGCSMVSHCSMVPPPTPSAVSVLPGGPSDGVDGPRARSTPARTSETGPHPSDTTDPPSMEQGGRALVAAAAAIAGTAVSTPRPTATGVVTAALSIAAATPAPVAQATRQEEEYDSFDEGGAEDAGGMIDQLVSGGPPVHVPHSTASHAGAPSVASHAPGPHLPVIPDGLLVAASSGAAVQSGITTQGSVSTANVNTDQMVAMLAAGREARRIPAGVTGPADLFGTGAGVFSTAAAAAAAGAADASLEHTSRMPNDTLSEGETWILQEFCGGGTLQDAIDSGRLRTEPSRLRGKPHVPYILLTAQEIASAMACVHSRGYMHGDLSAVNVLLTDAAGGLPSGGTGRGWIAKVSDFGLAKSLPDPTQPCISSAYGVITHCAPEVLTSHTQTQKADCYSFGVLLWQMFTGSRPWANMNRFQILGAVTGEASPGLRFLPTHQPPSRYSDLTMRCLSRDPAARPTFAEICEELRLLTYDAACAGEFSG